MCDSDPPKPPQHHGSSGQLKRKREDSYIVYTQYASDPAKVRWDKTTYRITRIHEEFDRPRLSQAIKSLFELRDEEFNIHSLAFDTSDETEPRSKVATISFRTRPTPLTSSSDSQKEWGFDISPNPENQTERNRIYFDTHFKNFTPLSPAERDGEYTIDCILIHGWGGHAIGSFESSTSSYVWPRDSLSKHCPQLQIWTYGYDSRLTDPDSTADVYEYAETFKRHLRILRKKRKANESPVPIILMVHSLGGWILKEAVIRMNDSTDLEDRLNLKSIYGALFFGVPNQGMNVDAIASMVENLPARYTSSLLDKRLGFQLRNRQHEDFCKAFPYKDSKIVQFFELRKSPTVTQDGESKRWSRNGPPVLLVDPSSATHGRSWETGSEYIVSLDGDHSSMVKFSDNDRDGYEKVRGIVQDFVSDADTVIKARMQVASSENSLLPVKGGTRSPKFQGFDPALYLERRKLMMETLNFGQAESRQGTIRKAHLKTCEWLLQQSEYQDWLDWNKVSENHGFLWIKGKPGTGKSTLMKYALEQIKRTMSEGSIIISFFFNARGEELERSTIGMYRSLLFQLLQKLPRLQGILDSLDSATATKRWNVEALKNTFLDAVESLEQEHLLCLVDALDECPENQVRDMIQCFESLGELAASNRIRLHVCFSSRHYPHISIKAGLELILENQAGHSNDINTYLSTELKAGRGKQVQDIKTQILGKASGIFLWVVLVVQILNKEYDNGRIYALRKRLREIPTELNELFKDILVRDKQNIEELLLCIQWILYAKQPLKREEFYFAVLSGQEPQSLNAWNANEVTHQDMERYILSSSKGLAEMTRSKSNPTVQFIHESVREFLLTKDALIDLWPGFRGISKGLSHEQLKNCCYNYMRIDISEHLALTNPLPLASTREAAGLRELANMKFPFLDYAVHHVLEHADIAEENGVAQSSFVQSFALDTWIKLDSLLQRYQRRRLTQKASLLYILADRGLPNLIRIQPREGSMIAIENERYESPLLAALVSGNKYTIRAFLQPNSSLQPNDGDFFHLDTGLDRDLDALESLRGRKPLKGQNLLCYVAERGLLSIVKLLVEREDVEADSKDKYGRTPLSYAAWNGHEAVVKLLVEREDVEADSKNKDGRTPLSYAALNGHEAVVKLLVEREDVEADSKDKYGRTPLSYAAWARHEAVVKLLVEREDVEADSKDKDGRTPLSYAAWDGHEAVVKLLVEREDVEADSKNNFGRTPLSYAASAGHEAVVKILRPS